MSLRLRLNLVLAVLLALLAGGAALHAFRQASRESDEFLDRQQRQMARYIGDADFLSAKDVDLPQTETEDDYAVVVRHKSDNAISSSDQSVTVPEFHETGFSSFTDASGAWRVFTLVRPERTIQIAQRMEVRDELARDAAWNAAIPIVLAIPLSWIVLFLFTRLAFRPLEQTARAVAQRDSTDLKPIGASQVPVEVLPLVEAFNGLLGRVEQVLAQQKAFIADAAHALRTPLAALSLQIDNARSVTTEPSVRERLDELKAGAARASALARNLLLLAQVEARAPAKVEAVALAPIATQALADFTPFAATRRIDLGFRHREDVEVAIPAHELRVLLDVLIDNALRYTPIAGTVDVSITTEGRTARLSIADTGPGIAEEDLARVFQRFGRASSGDEEGSGLGLAIARSIAEKYALSLVLRNRADRVGLTAIVIFERRSD